MGTRVLIVEDEASMRHYESQVLERRGYCCSLAGSTAEARCHLERETFELAIVDIGLPDESGLELARTISSNFPMTAMLMVTGVDDPEVAQDALESGAYGYLVKPFQPNELVININDALRRHKLDTERQEREQKLEGTIRQHTAALQQAVAFVGESQKDVDSAREETVLRLARAGECRDDNAGRHVQRMSRYCALLAQRLGLDPERCEQIRLASILHDIGKIGIPDRILLKPGPLDPLDFNIMKQHTNIGYRILLGSKAEVLQLAAIIAWTHHEKYDGTGYPQGLSGEAIPLEGRIASIADVFDALTSNRVYRPAFSLTKALGTVREERGKHFDPVLLDLFFGSFDQVTEIRHALAD